MAYSVFILRGQEKRLFGRAAVVMLMKLTRKGICPPWLGHGEWPHIPFGHVLRPGDITLHASVTWKHGACVWGRCVAASRECRCGGRHTFPAHPSTTTPRLHTIVCRLLAFCHTRYGDRHARSVTLSSGSQAAHSPVESARPYTLPRFLSVGALTPEGQTVAASGRIALWRLHPAVSASHTREPTHETK
ncbi:hypothetical protein BaRGS_00019095 [Batillaria attramentaria]|uniref:Uncharacterized protein n=1 Tax=Batillaria attramentaria TaxID=370345 RepID=A0ABD0KSE0_9CAEN